MAESAGGQPMQATARRYVGCAPAPVVLCDMIFARTGRWACRMQALHGRLVHDRLGVAHQSASEWIRLNETAYIGFDLDHALCRYKLLPFFELVR